MEDMMQIPIGENGHPTASATQLRTYGAGGFVLDDQEEPRGCPRQYKAKYVEHRIPEQKSDALRYGGLIHDCLYRMEEDSIGPEEALERVFPPDFPPEMWRRALDDLNAYLERGASPTDRFATIAVEQKLTALLYTDEEYGPVYYTGILDWLGFDLDDDGLIHVIDYKSNQAPARRDALAGDVQLKGYDWLVRQNWSRYSRTPMPRIVVHLDLIKWSDYEWRYTPDDVESWRSWAEAVCRRILRDEDALPVLNDGCRYCPVRGDCPAIEQTPQAAETLLSLAPADREAKWRWRENANRLRLLLEKRVEEIDAEFKQAAESGPVKVGGLVWRREPNWVDRYDLPALHFVLGDAFYAVVNPVKKRIEQVTAGWSPSSLAAVRAVIDRVPDGTKVTRKKET